jgi:hypothetical protein
MKEVMTVMGSFNMKRYDNLQRLYSQSQEDETMLIEQWNGQRVEWVRQFAAYMLEFLEAQLIGQSADNSNNRSNDYSIIERTLKEIPLETRLKVSNEMWLISVLVDMGVLDDKEWEDTPADNEMLSRIKKYSTEQTDHELDIILQWQRDGAPLT